MLFPQRKSGPRSLLGTRAGGKTIGLAAAAGAAAAAALLGPKAVTRAKAGTGHPLTGVNSWESGRTVQTRLQEKNFRRPSSIHR